MVILVSVRVSHGTASGLASLCSPLFWPLCFLALYFSGKNFSMETNPLQTTEQASKTGSIHGTAQNAAASLFQSNIGAMPNKRFKSFASLTRDGVKPAP